MIAYYLILTCAGGLMWRIGVHPMLILDSEELILINPIGEVRVKWDDVADMVPDYNGLRILLKSGAFVIANDILTNANLSRWSGESTPSDMIAQYLMEVVRANPDARGPLLAEISSDHSEAMS
jgi:hypothetical protein